MIKKLFMNILNYGADPWSLLKCARVGRDLGSVRGLYLETGLQSLAGQATSNKRQASSLTVTV